MVLRDLIRLVRPKHWVKNLFLLAPLVFSRELVHSDQVIRSMLAAALFSIAASSVYIFNDIIDRNRDSRNPRTRDRPIPSGRVSVTAASVTAILLGLGALIGAGLMNWKVAAAILAYLVLNLAYTLYLDRQVILDVMSIAAGFIIRLYAGAFAIDVQLSHWILVTTFFLSLYLGFGKRRREVLHLERNEEGIDRTGEYSSRLLDSFISISAAMTIISYSMYAVGTTRLFYTVPFVVFGLFRYHYLVYRKKPDDDPTDCILGDAVLLTCVAIWCLLTGLIILFSDPAS